MCAAAAICPLFSVEKGQLKGCVKNLGVINGLWVYLLKAHKRTAGCSRNWRGGYTSPKSLIE